MAQYHGRIAPTPTGYLHIGHAKTFQMAYKRAKHAYGILTLRIEDIDKNRCKEKFIQAAIEDIQLMEIQWDYGPNKAGPHEPYFQSQRLENYSLAKDKLLNDSHIYPCTLSRKDIEKLGIPKDTEGEPIISKKISTQHFDPLKKPNWRFQVPQGQKITFIDNRLGKQNGIAGKDFGDFIIWNRDNIPAYELAVVVDDIAMQITEVVRGEDLLKSTFRQILIYNALSAKPPAFYHCPLMMDKEGNKLSKSNRSKSFRDSLNTAA
jgi:glutamyl-tRNA synthetase